MTIKRLGGSLVGARAHMTANVAMGSGASDIQADFAAIGWAYGGLAVDLTANTFTAPITGLYLWNGSAQIYSASAGFRSIIVYINGTRVTEIGRSEIAGFEGPFPGALTLPLNAGDSVTMNYYASGQVSTAVGNAAGTATWMSLVLIAP